MEGVTALHFWADGPHFAAQNSTRDCLTNRTSSSPRVPLTPNRCLLFGRSGGAQKRHQGDVLLPPEGEPITPAGGAGSTVARAADTRRSSRQIGCATTVPRPRRQTCAPPRRTAGRSRRG